MLCETKVLECIIPLKLGDRHDKCKTASCVAIHVPIHIYVYVIVTVTCK